ncbi:diaminopimelate decarboxylase [Amphritea balenae]|uniref:Diaminopimelate decarboxylase n=1 Tax=Amphritea balenae TaxID=452629 RepID=A0A3P1SZK4_9GAMM|nr:diaminopimelate decarboxylase [Amphritea balenae]RRD01563.1 diaminopimelate decarboxylase [Amphritea balenae]GGK55867.1 diaminopimelate decarboxylase [Amphritea balenae]
MNQAVALHPWNRPNHLSSEENQLTIDGVKAIDLIEQYGSPLYVYSENKLRQNAHDILSNFRRVHEKTRVCFASKACANIAVLKVFKDAGLSIEVNSGGEFFKACTAGYRPEDMVFNGVAKQYGELHEVIEAGIRAINVDSLSELQRILKVALSLNKRANVTLRIIPEIKGGASAGWETGTSESKFGMTREEQVFAIELINSHPDYLKMTGIHAHIGTQVNDISAYQAEANFLIDYAKEVRELLPYRLEHINLGGGYPKNYTSHQENLDTVAEHYKQNYRTCIDFNVLSEILIKPITNALGCDIEIIVEPGRSMVSDVAVMLTRIEAEKSRNQNPVYYLDAGYSVLFDIYNGWYFHMVNASRSDDTDTKLCRMVGPLCDSSDTYYDIEGEGRVKSLLKTESAFEAHQEVLEQVLVHQPNMRELPVNTQVGDVIALLDTGAYALEMMNEYCGRQASAAVLVDLNQDSRLIRRRAKYEDLLTYDVVCNSEGNSC